MFIKLTHEKEKVIFVNTEKIQTIYQVSSLGKFMTKITFSDNTFVFVEEEDTEIILRIQQRES